MPQNFHSLIPEIKKRMNDEFLRETSADTEELLAVPYPYVVPAKKERDALFYWDTYFINLGLIRMKMIDQARHNVENLIFLLRKFGFVPASNRKDLLTISHPPFLPWMVRDVYRATGDKEWLRRTLPDVAAEYRFWTNKAHTTANGLYRYALAKGDPATDEKALEMESGWIGSPRFEDLSHCNPVDLNALLYRNAMIIYDLQIEAEGKGDESLLQKSKQIQKLMEFCWDETDGFYYDNDFHKKQLRKVKTMAGFFPIFVEMVPQKRARLMQKQLKSFVQPGGLACMDKTYGSGPSPWNYPLCYAPLMYFTIKGLCDYEIMEDAADIGTNWLTMVAEIYQNTGEFWEWYDVAEKSVKASNSVPNRPIMGWTAGVFIALIDALGLE